MILESNKDGVVVSGRGCIACMLILGNTSNFMEEKKQYEYLCFIISFSLVFGNQVILKPVAGLI